MKKSLMEEWAKRLDTIPYEIVFPSLREFQECISRKALTQLNKRLFDKKPLILRFSCQSISYLCLLIVDD